MIRTAILVMIVVIALAGSASAGDVVLIVNAQNPATAIHRADVARLFLQTGRWENGEKAVPVDLGNLSPVREEFSTTMLGRSVSAVVAYWNQKLFSGGGVPPVQKKTDSQVVEFVRANPSAIGYVSSSVPLEGVKVLKVID